MEGLSPPPLLLRPASDAERRAVNALNFAEWHSGLTLEQYHARDNAYHHRCGCCDYDHDAFVQRQRYDRLRGRSNRGAGSSSGGPHGAVPQ